MKKEYVEIKIPIFDEADEIEIVKTFNEQQLYYVCALAKAFENLENEKQRLINWLEDKIKENNKTLELLEDTGSIRISILQSQIKTLQEVLDFVNKGGKE